VAGRAALGARLKVADEPKPPRTFENSEVRDYSWPCILVLVDAWVDADRFGPAPDQVPPQEMVPTTLYLPDGRTVPVCVVLVERAEPVRDLLPSWTWPDSLIGGGFPLISESQGQESIASVGALVTDGHTVFALTSRHVAGPKSHPVSTELRGRRVQVGASSDRQLTRLPFGEVYADFPARRTYLTLDAGLIEIDDLDLWSSQIYGLPAMGELADLSERNIGMRLINAEVVAFGAASGQLWGRIAALFHRYRSIGGYDDVTDFLIAPKTGTPGSQPGDSGTVWHLLEKGSDRPLRPIALQWGGQNFLATTTSKNFNFTLAASLTNVIRLLEVELVVEHNRNAQPFWGKTGHYSLATFACDQVIAPGLRTLMAANADKVSFPIMSLDPKEIDRVTKEAKRNGAFMPLADVPDLVWKNLPSVVPGGRDPRPRSGPEHPTHYADIDEPLPNGSTLRQLCVADPANVAVAFWKNCYTSLGHADSSERGLLPFRVWQFYDALVDALEDDDLVQFVCAAGLMAHYVGDGCQPLHGSRLADGVGPPTNKGRGVHSAYETYMVDHRADEIIQGLVALLPVLAQAREPLVSSGHEAAVAVVNLMDRTATAVDPETLVDAYAATQTGTTKNPTHNQAVSAALWEELGQGTIRNLADGALTLAGLWESAWAQAGGENRFDVNDLVAIDPDALRALYEDPDFVPSLDLDNIVAVLR